MPYCSFCGEQAEADGRFCTGCGQPLPVQQSGPCGSPATRPSAGVGAPPQPPASQPGLTQRSDWSASTPGISPEQRARNRRIALQATWIAVVGMVFLLTVANPGDFAGVLVGWILLGAIVSGVILATSREPDAAAAGASTAAPSSSQASPPVPPPGPSAGSPPVRSPQAPTASNQLENLPPPDPAERADVGTGPAAPPPPPLQQD